MKKRHFLEFMSANGQARPVIIYCIANSLTTSSDFRHQRSLHHSAEPRPEDISNPSQSYAVGVGLCGLLVYFFCLPFAFAECVCLSDDSTCPLSVAVFGVHLVTTITVYQKCTQQYPYSHGVMLCTTFALFLFYRSFSIYIYQERVERHKETSNHPNLSESVYIYSLYLFVQSQSHIYI